MNVGTSKCRFWANMNKLISVKKILAVINATYAVAKRKPASGFLFATA